MKIQEIINLNRAMIARLRLLNIRAGKVIFPVPSRKELRDKFAVALGGARKVGEIEDLNSLLLPDLDPEKVKKVLDESPDTIQVLGQETPVQYSEYLGPMVEIFFEGETWKDLPDSLLLPDGRPVVIRCQVGRLQFRADNPVELKNQIRYELNKAQWDLCKKPEIPFKPEDENSQVPFITFVFGKCVMTEEDLVAYGTIVFQKSLLGGWRSIWYTTSKREAKNVFDRSVKKLAEERNERRASSARTQAEAESDKTQEVLEPTPVTVAEEEKREVTPQELAALADFFNK